MFVEEVPVRTRSRVEFVNIDGLVRDFIKKSGINEGFLTLFVPHTTAAITINENADPSVVRDIIRTTSKLVPYKGDYDHFEGNSDAHIKASLFGHSETVIVSGGKPLLGTWQSLYFCEFDGPRTRRLIISIS